MDKPFSPCFNVAETSTPDFPTLLSSSLLIKGYQSPSTLFASVQLFSLQLTDFSQVAFLACYKALICNQFQLEKWLTSVKRLNNDIRFFEM